MIKVTLGTNTQRKTVIVPPDTTLRTVLEDNEVNYAATNVHLDGVALQPGDMDKTFAEIGIKESCYLIAVVKADNA